MLSPQEVFENLRPYLDPQKTCIGTIFAQGRFCLCHLPSPWVVTQACLNERIISDGVCLVIVTHACSLRQIAPSFMLGLFLTLPLLKPIPSTACILLSHHRYLVRLHLSLGYQFAQLSMYPTIAKANLIRN